MKLTHNCPKCGKPAKIQAEFPIGNMVNYVYQCGHCELLVKQIQETPKIELKEAQNAINSNLIPTITINKLSENYIELDRWVTDGGITKTNGEIQYPDYDKFNPAFQSVDSKKVAYAFQISGIRFAESTQLNCLIADAMGLGKTIQGIKSIWRNASIACPCLVLVKGATVFQWASEILVWADKNIDTVIPITNRKHIFPGFKFYVLSMDMIGKKDVRELLLKCGIKSVVIDECQNFKDPNARRTEGLLEFIKLGQIKYKIGLSGTPIKNRVTEYGVMLNMLLPGYFPNSRLESKWLLPEVKTTMNGNKTVKYERLNPLMANKFHEITSKCIIRRERHDVLTNLPALMRDFQIVEIDDPAIKSTYNRTVSLFANWLNDNKSGASSSQLLGWLAQIRAITGQAKCKDAVEWLEDFLESTEETISIGIHHKSVRETLYYVLKAKGITCEELSGEDNVYQKAEKVRRFTRGDFRVFILNSIAGGVGLNLQTCAQALVLERQWNSADEEQFECRFHRDGQQKAVTITYLIAKGTIDEFFHEMVTRKRKILLEAGMGKKEDVELDLDFLKELSDKVANSHI